MSDKHHLGNETDAEGIRETKVAPSGRGVRSSSSHDAFHKLELVVEDEDVCA